MKYYQPILLILSVCLFSCAITTNNDMYRMHVSANTQDARLLYNGETFALPCKVELYRSSDPVSLTVYNNDTTRNLTLNASLCPQFVRGNITYPIFGHLLDLASNRRFYYGKSLFIDMADTTSVIKTGFNPFYKKPLQKGSWNWILSLPYINGFNMQPEGESLKQLAGFWGLSAGGEYVYRTNSFLQLSAGVCSSFPIPVPGPLDRMSDYETMANTYVMLTDNVKWYAFTFGYGVHFSNATWRYIYRTSVPVPYPDISKSKQSLGVACNVYWRLGPLFYIGMVYRPTVYNLQPLAGFQYGHTLSFDLQWKFPLLKQAVGVGHISTL